MVLSFIVAASDDNAIGINNQLPWHLPEDLKFFKRTTIGKPVIMGRNTFESLGRPLPGRFNIVLTGRSMDVPEGVLVCHDVPAAISRLQNDSIEEAFIIGGGKVFASTMNFADRLYVTRVHTTIPGADAFFPAIDHTHWKLVWEEKHTADAQHKYDFTFQKFERIEL